MREVNFQLIELNNERESLLSNLTDSDTFAKFKKYQKDLVSVESRLLKFQEKLDAIDRIISKQQEIEELKQKIETINKEVENE